MSSPNRLWARFSGSRLWLRLRSISSVVWDVLDRVGWIIAIVFVAIALGRIKHDEKIHHAEEKTHSAEAAHTRAVQKAGEPTGVCLREAAVAGLPILITFANELERARAKTPRAQQAVVTLFVGLARKVEAPLKEYVRLQENRYKGVVCPIPKPKPK